MLEPHFVLQISQPPGFAQQWFYIYDLCMDLSFQKKKLVGKSISQLLKYVTNNQIKKLYIFYGTPFIHGNIINIVLVLFEYCVYEF